MGGRRFKGLSTAGLTCVFFLAACSKKEVPSVLQPGCLVSKPATFTAQVLPTLERSCFSCHSSRNEHTPSAGLDLEAFSAEPEAHLVTWRRALQKITDGEMPPEGSSRVSVETCDRLALATWLDEQSAQSCRGKAPALTRRLSNSEYDRSLTALLGMDLQLSRKLPVDLPSLGFDSLVSGMRITPEHMARYLLAAEEAAGKILEARPKSFHFDSGSWIGTSPEEPFHSVNSGGEELSQMVTLTRSARYLVRVRAYGEQAGNETVRLVLGLGSSKSGEIQVPATIEAPDTYEFTTSKLPVGTQRLMVRFVNDFFEPKSPPPYDRNLRVGWAELVELPGDLGEPLGKLQHLTHCQIAEAESVCAERVLKRFAADAYRRSLAAEDEAGLKGVLAEGLKEGFENGLKLGFQTVLASPAFLFKVEERSEVADGEPLSGEELATRLSYFLWSAPPDEALLKSATNNRIQELGPLLSETRRLLRDPKAAALTDNFAEQWLDLRELQGHADSPSYPEFTANLRASLLQETKLLFSFVLKAGLGVEKLLLADFSFLDRSLAKLYGVSGVDSDEFQLVSLVGTERGGLLTHGSILTSTSHPERTSPTLRGKWILNNLLCLPPPPPMPGIAVLPEKVPAGLTMRQLMEQHAGQPACASCHRQMDPLGFGLENYDAIGRWRSSEGTVPVDASGKLPSGETFRGAFELSEIVANRPEYRRCLSRKLFIYALGRDLAPPEECAVGKAVNRLQEKNSFGTVIEEIVQSDLFRKKSGE